MQREVKTENKWFCFWTKAVLYYRVTIKCELYKASSTPRSCAAKTIPLAWNTRVHVISHESWVYKIDPFNAILCDLTPRFLLFTVRNFAHNFIDFNNAILADSCVFIL
jgi:hypothetical protein